MRLRKKVLERCFLYITLSNIIPQIVMNKLVHFLLFCSLASSVIETREREHPESGRLRAERAVVAVGEVVSQTGDGSDQPTAVDTEREDQTRVHGGALLETGDPVLKERHEVVAEEVRRVHADGAYGAHHTGQEARSDVGQPGIPERRRSREKYVSVNLQNHRNEARIKYCSCRDVQCGIIADKSLRNIPIPDYHLNLTFSVQARVH